MALVKANQYGQSYEWGFLAADAPTIVGMVARKAELRYEPEVNSEASDGEGHTDSVTVSKKENRKINATFSGYITAGFDGTGIGESFTFKERFYIVGPIGEPRNKGEYVEVSVEAMSHAGVTGPAS